MSDMDFQRCHKCNKVLDMACSCSPENYIVQLPVCDHISKAELREYCLDKIDYMNFHGGYMAEMYVPYKNILQRFCKGEK